MRLFHVWVTFQRGGSGYPLKHYSRVHATSIEAAAGRGIREAKRYYGGRFRIAEDAKYEVNITAGSLVEKEA